MKAEKRAKQLLQALSRFQDADANDDTCQICGGPFTLRYGAESTGFCDSCAQAKLRDTILIAREIDKAYRKNHPHE